MATFNSIADMLSFGLIGKLRKKLLEHADLDKVETYTADPYVNKEYIQCPPLREQKIDGCQAVDAFASSNKSKRLSSSSEYLCPKRSKSVPSPRYKHLKSASNLQRSNSQNIATKSASIHSTNMNREKSWESATSKKIGFLPLFSKRKSMNNDCAGPNNADKGDSSSSSKISSTTSFPQYLSDPEYVPNINPEVFAKRPVAKKMRGSNYVAGSPRYHHLRDHSKYSHNNTPSTVSIKSSNSSVTDINPSFRLVLDDHIMPGVPTPSPSTKLH